MRTLLQRTATALFMCALLGTAALADVKSKQVTIYSDVTVGDTPVKKGSYKVTFDDQSKELKLIKAGKVVAQARASVAPAKGANKTNGAYTTLRAADGTSLLATVELGGSYAIIESEKIAAVRSEQNAQ